MANIIKKTPLQYTPKSGEIVQGVNWNTIPSSVDIDVWNRLTSNFWLPEKIPVSNDITSWNNLTEAEQWATMRVFAQLTVLDTIQGTVGATSIMHDALTPHEEAVYANIAFMEALSKDMCVLSPEGWISISDVEDGDVIAQFDPTKGNDGVIEFVEANTVPSHVSHEVYDIKIPGGARMTVSGGHRMYVERENGTYAVYEARDLLEALKNGAEFYVRTSTRSDLHALQTTLSFEEAMDMYVAGKTETSPLEKYDAVQIDNADGDWFYSILNTISNRYQHVLWEPEDVALLQAWSVVVGVSMSVTEVKNKYAVEFSYDKRVKIEADHFEQLDPQTVYCVTVPSTFLYVKHNSETSMPVVTGNCVHAKSYSNIFMTLASTEEINNVFRWADENQHVQKKAQTILDFYKDDDPYNKKIASTVLESFLFYSGFYLPLKMSSNSKLVNTADIIRLIIRDEAVHGYYIGHKFQESVSELTSSEQEEYQDMAFDLIMDMYDIEVPYTESIYDDLGWTEDVKRFLRYNANKALNNLGYDGLFPADTTNVSASILSSLSPQGDENHDFFSGSGSTYVIGDAEDTSDDDWDW